MTEQTNDPLADALAPRAEVERLATWIIENIPGEPSRSEGAVDTAIRLLGQWQNHDRLAAQVTRNAIEALEGSERLRGAAHADLAALREGIEAEAKRVQSAGHHWSGAPAHELFAVADRLRALLDPKPAPDDTTTPHHHTEGA